MINKTSYRFTVAGLRLKPVSKELSTVNRQPATIFKVVAILVLVAVLFLVLALSATTAEAGKGVMSVNVQQAELRDVLSLVATKMEVTMLFLEEEGLAGKKITLQLDDVTPTRMLDVLLSAQGLVYFQDGQIMFIGSKEKINEALADKIIPVKMKLYFMPATDFAGIASALGLAECIVIDESTLLVKDIPAAVAQVRDLLVVLDSPERLAEGLKRHYRFFEVKNITPQRATELLRAITGEMAAELVAAEAAAREARIEAEVAEAVGGEHLETTYLPVGTRLLVTTNLLHRLEQIEILLPEIDIIDNREQRIFVYNLKNTYAAYVIAALAELNITMPEGTAYHIVSMNYPEFSQTLLISCSPAIERQLREYLALIDRKNRETISVTFPLGGDADPWELRNLLVDVTGVSAGNMKIYGLGPDGVTAPFILYVHDTPENLAKIEAALGRIGG